jgi:hypothetical protein
MKVFASIMAFVVLFLSVQPALALFEKKQKAECCSGCYHKDSGTPKKEQPTKNTSNNFCNPFQSCGSCVGYTPDFSIISVFEPFEGAKSAIVTQQAFSQFSSDFWQPPKIV